MVYKENINVKPYAPPEKDYIKKESEKILKVVKSFCDIAKIESDRIKYNSPTIKDIVIRMDMRQLYFKIYHDNMSINEYKCNTGLLIFWILKLHPFWIDVESNDSQQIINIATNINEQISLHLAVSLLKEYNPVFLERGKDLLQDYCNELLYSFRYRDLSKESLYLMFDPFYYTHLFDKTVDINGKIIL